MTKSPRQALVDADVDQSELSRLLNVSKAAVSQWFADGGRVPAERCLEIQKLTGGKVRAKDLRPELPWEVVSDSEWDGSERRKAA